MHIHIQNNSGKPPTAVCAYVPARMQVITFVSRLCLPEEINLLAYLDRESAIGNNTSKGEHYPCISHSQFLSFAINVIGV
jgi:hypothetical protein